MDNTYELTGLHVHYVTGESAGTVIRRAAPVLEQCLSQGHDIKGGHPHQSPLGDGTWNFIFYAEA